MIFCLYRTYALFSHVSSSFCCSTIHTWDAKYFNVTITNSAQLPLGATKNLHSLSLFVCLIFTPHTPNCIIFDVLYVSNITFLSLCFTNCSIFVLGNNILNMSSDIELPSLPISTLYLNFSHFCLPLVSKFCNMLALMLFKFMRC